MRPVEHQAVLQEIGQGCLVVRSSLTLLDTESQLGQDDRGNPDLADRDPPQEERAAKAAERAAKEAALAAIARLEAQLRGLSRKE